MIADPLAPGLRVPADSFLYQVLRDELDQARHGLATVDLARSSNFYPEREHVTAEHVRQALEACIVVEADGRKLALVAGDSLEITNTADITDRVFAKYES